MRLRLTIAGKLIAGFLSLALLLAVVGVYFMFALRDSTERTRYIVENEIPRIQTLLELRAVIGEVVQEVSNALDADVSAAQAESEGGAERKFRLLAAIDRMNTLENRLAEADQPEDRQIFGTIRVIRDRLTIEALNLISLKEQGAPAETIDASALRLNGLKAELSRLAETAVDASVERTFQEASETSRASDRALRLTYLVNIAAILVAIIAGLIFARLIARPIIAFRKAADEIAQGRLDKRVPVNGSDEIADLAVAFNDMAEKLEVSYGSLKAEKERFATALQSIGDGAIVLDEARKVTLFNPAAQRIAGAPSFRVEGRPYRDTFKFVSEKDSSLHEGFIDQAFAGNVVRVDDAVLESSSGQRVEVDGIASPIRDGRGRVTGAMILIRDVGEQRALDRMKSEFISLAAHQLRTPLSALRWSLELGMSDDLGKLEPERKEVLVNAFVAAEKMNEVITNLLNIARIDAQRMSVKPESVDLGELARQVVNLLKPLHEKKGQKLVVDVQKDMPKVSTDPKILSEALSNLVSNAVKYSPQDSTVTVSIKADGPEAVISVRDQGMGIPKDQQSQVFQKFFRASNAVKDVVEGTGLGLYIVQSLVHLLGGTIGFASQEGTGTEFHFTLPLAGSVSRTGERGLV